jgi:peptidoglycan hydrolase-like protein with peptidoglycan-binding domain
MAGMHTVKQGEYMAFIAAQYGFTNWQTIWNLPQNANLKSQRQNPNVLFPGDQVYVPDPAVKNVAKPTDNTHTFKLKNSTLKLLLTLQDMYEKPIANAKCVLSLDGNTVNVTTDGNGGINQDIPPKTQSGILVIQDSQTPLNNTQIPILIGNLDPVDQVSGQIARLNNLGYAAGDPSKPPVSGDGNSDGNSAGGGGDGADGASGTGSLFSTDPFSSAVQEFQCDNGLTVDGICGPVTQASLKQVHGC